MAAPTWFFMSFMVLLSLAICSAQPKETDHHNHKAETLSNIDAQGFGGGSGGGLGVVGGGFSIGGGGGGFSIGIGGGRFGVDIGGLVPGYGSPIYIPGFDIPIYTPACGFVCPANNPSGEITEFKISGLSSHFTQPYRCRPGPNTRGDRDYNQELLLHFVSTMQDKHENKLQYGGHGEDVGYLIGGSRRLGFGRGSGSDHQYDTEDPGTSFDGCGYVCPGNSPSEGITEFKISGLLSLFNGPYRCRPDVCDTENCGEFLLHFVSHNKHEKQHGHQSEQQDEEIPNGIPDPPTPQS